MGIIPNIIVLRCDEPRGAPTSSSKISTVLQRASPTASLRT